MRFISCLASLVLFGILKEKCFCGGWRRERTGEDGDDDDDDDKNESDVV